MKRHKMQNNKCVPHKARRQARELCGIYYTPPAVVRLVLRPVDPATGTGDFLFTNPPLREAAKTL